MSWMQELTEGLLLRQLADVRKTTSIIETHDHRIIDFADRVIRMEDGKIVQGAN